ncbi:MAG TPA: homoserine kinase [Acidimicrobiia bacterium]|nr:homoserine kinase [Acidimicrobiia bacterium]
MSQDLHSATASAPATSANLGPGFDCIALALDIRCTVKASHADQWSVEHVGRYRPASEQSDGVLAAARRVVGDATPLTIQVDADIPIGKGLGSSAAASVAGIAATMRLAGEDPGLDHVYRIGVELEGHADNVAAAVYGGLTLVPAEGLPLRLPFHPGLQVVVAVPDRHLATEQARRVIDPFHPQDRVLRSLARVAALTAGLITGDPELLTAAHGDEIHERPRDGLSPEVAGLIEVGKGAGALHAARSGSGPSVIALCTNETRERVVAAFTEAGLEVLTPQLATTGLI